MRSFEQKKGWPSQSWSWYGIGLASMTRWGPSQNTWTTREYLADKCHEKLGGEGKGGLKNLAFK